MLRASTTRPASATPSAALAPRPPCLQSARPALLLGRPGRVARAAAPKHGPHPLFHQPGQSASLAVRAPDSPAHKQTWARRVISGLPLRTLALAAFVLVATQFILPPPASALSFPWAKPAPPPPPPPGLMESIVGAAKTALSFVLHLDTHLGAIIAKHGPATYALLFAIVFCETGLVLTPFLPGDSLLFAAGTFASLGSLHLPTLLAVFVTSAFLGDAVNYAAGAFLGSRAVEKGIVKKEAIAKTEAFYAKHGGRAVVLARFVPIVRTFAPFVAGVAAMPYKEFSAYNAGGAVLWGVGLTVAGALFGNLPFVRDNFTAVVLGIVAVSLLPLAVEVWMAKREAQGKGGGSAAA